MSMGQHQRNDLSAVLRDSVVVMLFDTAQLHGRPGKKGATPHAFEVQR
jgi:hypothetical protein